MKRRPSASLVISIVALVVAATGTAIAAGKVGGDKLIKKNSLSGNRLRKHTVTGTQLKLSKLGKVPSAAKADSATSAQNAVTVGGRSFRWMLADPSGTIVSQSGGFTLTAHPTSGQFIFSAGSGLAGHAMLVSNGVAGDTMVRGESIAGPCGTGSEAIDCSSTEAGANDGNHFLVVTHDTTNGTLQGHSFYLVIY